jgi:hypothetical protein
MAGRFASGRRILVSKGLAATIFLSMRAVGPRKKSRARKCLEILAKVHKAESANGWKSL